MIRALLKVDGTDVAEIIKDGSETKVKVKSISKILATPILTKVALDLKPIFDSEGNKISLGKTFFAGIFGKK
ncbi:MAG: hypothetical protein K0B07_04090 [DPANN group archaeon]|nr:hypothetical protein [DPANN group archaeon]